MTERLSATRRIAAAPEKIFAVLSDPQGHVSIDSSGMLQDATGKPVAAVGERFTVHMDRKSLGDIPEMGKYDVDVVLTAYEPNAEIAWTIDGTIQPPIGHIYGYRLTPDGEETEVEAYYDWSTARDEWKRVFPILNEGHLSATLGILVRTVRRGYPGASG